MTGSAALDVAPATDRRRTVLAHVILAALTATAFYLRFELLAGAQGQIGEDDGRLVLAAGGVMETGLPTMPSGLLYFRGVASSYLSALSMLLLGRTDLAARLPNVIAGALLVPLVFCFGRRLAGTVAGLCVAAFVTFQAELIVWSASAWMTSFFVSAAVLSAYLLHRGFVDNEPGMQVAGGVAAIGAVLAHELGAALGIAVFVFVGVQLLRGDRSWRHGATSGVALTLCAASLAMLAALGLYLRAETVAGPTGEFRHYFGPNLSPDRLMRDVERWRHAYLPIAIAAIAGTPWAFRRGRPGPSYLYTLIGVHGATIWVVMTKGGERYGLVLLPLGALAGAWAFHRLVSTVALRVGRRPRDPEVVASVVLVGAFSWALRGEILQARERFIPPATTWVTVIRELGFRSDDLVFSNNPEAPRWYLGRVDYWERERQFERYAYRDGDVVRHQYTGGRRVADAADWDRMVAANPGRRLWYIVDGDGFGGYPRPFRERIIASAEVDTTVRDDIRLMRFDLDNPALRFGSSSDGKVPAP